MIVKITNADTQEVIRIKNVFKYDQVLVDGMNTIVVLSDRGRSYFTGNFFINAKPADDTQIQIKKFFRKRIAQIKRYLDPDSNNIVDKKRALKIELLEKLEREILKDL